MGLIYAAELRPAKMELVADWLPSQPWDKADGSELVRLGSFRFDDPAGEVGIETLLVGAGKHVYQVPLTYRGAPLEGAEAFLITTMEHSVLGERWVYDAAGDPVYASELAAALLTGKAQAVETLEVDGRIERLPHTAVLVGGGMPDAGLPEVRLEASAQDAIHISAGTWDLVVLRALDLAGTAHSGPSLSVTWAGQEVPVLLSTAVRA
jgi:hypothetical protein